MGTMCDPEATLLAGSCRVDTTPKLGTDLGGYFTSRLCDSIERRLYAKALALRSGDTTVLMVSVDIIMMRAADIVDEAKARISASTGIGSDHIMVSATHTHNGPATIPRPGGPEVDADYIATVIDGIHLAAVGAVTTLVPAQIAYGQASVEGVCFNRRYLRTDGLVDWNPGTGRDDLVGPAGPIDPTVTGLIVEDLDGRVIGVWSNLSLHYVNADSPTAVSSDYYGAFDEQVQALFGPDTHSQLTNGCSGNINNVDLSEAVPTAGKTRADQVARATLGAVFAGTQMARRHRRVAVSSQLTTARLQRVPITEEDIQIAKDRIAEKRQDVPFSFVRGVPIRESLHVHYSRRLLALAETSADDREVPVMAITIGDLCIVSLPGEIFVELGLAIREGSRHPMTAVVGLANDHIGYVPDEKGFKEGNYESWRDTVSWTAPGSGEVLVDAALSLMGGAAS